MTMRKKRVTGNQVNLTGNLWRETEWAGVRKGDEVEIANTRLRSAKWEFIAHVRNIATGDEWIEVVGGRTGDRKVRSFAPDRVFAPSGRNGRPGPRSSLAEAPRLPFG